MRQNFKYVVPLLILIMLLVSACELQRSNEGDIAVEPPGVSGPTGAPPTEPPLPAEPSVEPSQEAPAASSGAGDETIDPNGVPASQTPSEGAVTPGTVVIKLNEEASIQARSVELDNNIVVSGVNSLDQKLQEIGASDLQPILEPVAESTGQDLNTLSIQAEGMSQLYTVSFSDNQDPVAVAATLNEDPNVEFAEPDYIAGIAGRPSYAPVAYQPNDPYFSNQWNLQAVQMPTAWDVTRGRDVVVAIIDTGVAFDAPDLAGTARMTGYDFVSNDADPRDDNGHGTHVAGTVAQTTNNGIGVAGVAFEATILPVKALAASGNGSYTDIIKAITYAVDQGADVINMSLAGRNGSQALQEAVKYAYDRGVVVVAAAGNDAQSTVYFPAGYDQYVIAVGAVRVDNTKTSYSNYGSALDLMAPGGDISVDQNNDGYGDGVLQQTFSSSGTGFSFRFFEGTSMASPHVAGLAALLFAQKSDASPDQIEKYMTDSARNLGSANEFGAGLIQAASALALVSPGVTPTTQPPTPTSTSTPTSTPTNTPSPEPTVEPTIEPTIEPTTQPTTQPTTEPTTQPTTQPTTEPTTQPPIILAGDLIVNGDFENDEGWIFGDTPVRGSIVSGQGINGSRGLKLGITDGRDIFSFTSAWQEATIPAEATEATLTAHIFPISQDSQGVDAQNILVLDQNFRVIRTLSRELSNSQTWETRTFDLTDLKGRTVYIYFGVFNRGRTGLPTAMYVDDVSLTWAK